MKALILIRLDAVEGDSVRVSLLASYLECTPDQVRAAAEMLVEEGQVQAERDVNGQIYLLRTRATLLHGAEA